MSILLMSVDVQLVYFRFTDTKIGRRPPPARVVAVGARAAPRGGPGPRRCAGHWCFMVVSAREAAGGGPALRRRAGRRGTVAAAMARLAL